MFLSFIILTFFFERKYENRHQNRRIVPRWYFLYACYGINEFYHDFICFGNILFLEKFAIFHLEENLEFILTLSEYSNFQFLFEWFHYFLLRNLNNYGIENICPPPRFSLEYIFAIIIIFCWTQLDQYSNKYLNFCWFCYLSLIDYHKQNIFVPTVFVVLWLNVVVFDWKFTNLSVWIQKMRYIAIIF